MGKIECRAPFSGWYTIPTKEKALEHARWMYRHITGRNPVKLINDRFRGIRFTEEELRNVRTE